MKNFVFASLAFLVLFFSACGSEEENTLGSDAGATGAAGAAGFAGSVGTCPVPGPDQTSTPAQPDRLGYLVSNGPVTCTNSTVFSQPPFKGVPCSDLAGNLTDSTNTAISYGPCCVLMVKDANDSRVTPVGVTCGNLMMDTPGFGGTTQYALCSASGSFLGWVCPPS